MSIFGDGFLGIQGTEIDIIISKLQLYNISELTNTYEIENALKEISLNYKSANSLKLDSILEEIINKLKTMKKNHDNNLTVLVKTKGAYDDASTAMDQIFEDTIGG